MQATVRAVLTNAAVQCMLCPAGLSMDVMDASGSTGNDVSRGKDVNLHKVCIRCAAQHTTRHFEAGL
jgi:hypothetical protein